MKIKALKTMKYTLLEFIEEGILYHVVKEAGGS